MTFWVIPIIFVAMFIQAMAGFGSALIAMPLLLLVLSPDEARPAFAILAQVAGIVFTYKYRAEWRLADIWRLLLAAAIGIPLGMFLADNLDEQTFMFLLGLLLIIYAIYSLIGFKVPEIGANWGYFFGFLSGFLHSAYNVGGPPLVMYGTSQTVWSPKRFKGNMQVLFFCMGFFVIGTHALQGRITEVVLLNVLLMIPAMLVALFLGFALDNYVKPQYFRVGVMILLAILGLNLIF